jgi:hypothetical protein
MCAPRTKCQKRAGRPAQDGLVNNDIQPGRRKYMTKTREVWERYTEAWGAESVEQKRELFETCLAPGCVYTDPTAVVKGWDALLEYMVGFHQQTPGGHFVTQEFMAHHGRSVSRWQMRGRDGTKLGDGISYAEYDDNGMLVAMTGFFGPPDAST